MDIYEVETKPAQLNPKYRIIGVLCFAAFLFLLRFGWSILAPTSRERSMGLSNVAIEIGIWSLVMAFGMVFFNTFFKTARPNYKLLVDEESMTGVIEFTGWRRWLALRSTVRKGRVRTISEIKTTASHPGGLRISERGMFGARMLSCVFLPKDLPEYDDLRRLVEGWRSVK